MADEELSPATLADQLGLDSGTSISRWLKATAKAAGESWVRAMDLQLEKYLKEEKNDRDSESEEEGEEEAEEEDEEEEAEEVREEYVTCDGPCGRRLTGSDVVFTDGAIEYCEACYPSLHRQLGLVLGKSTAAACLDEIDARNGDEAEGEDEAEAEDEGEGKGEGVGVGAEHSSSEAEDGVVVAEEIAASDLDGAPELVAEPLIEEID